MSSRGDVPRVLCGGLLRRSPHHWPRCTPRPPLVCAFARACLCALVKMESVIPGKAVEAEHLPRPDEVGTNWQCLFVECVSNNLLPLGLYRR